MDLSTNLESLQLCCRVCLQKGEINIWDFKVKIELPAAPKQYMGTSTEVSAFELIQVVSSTLHVLELTDEFPHLCLQCLEDFKLCYILQHKLQNASTYLKKIYNECLNQYIEEEHLLESPNVETIDLNEHYITDLEPREDEETSPDTVDILPAEDISLSENVKSNDNRSGSLKSLYENSSLVVTQFVPIVKYVSSTKRPAEDDEQFPQQRNLLTVDCKAVEIKDISTLESLKNPPPALDCETPSSTSSPVYVCQYCPKAFAKSEFLTLHLQRNHICKFCTQPFLLANDLYRHTREAHSVNKCVICHKVLSSSTNLRHHLKNVHGIKLPPKITLLDYIQTDEDNLGNSDRLDTGKYFTKIDDVSIVDDMDIN